jgi:phage terminase large subunit-like protein
MNLTVSLPEPHSQQRAFIDSTAKRKVIRAGRRGGKTVGTGIFAVEKFLQGRRVLYAAPTQDQIDRFWEVCKRALHKPIEAGIFYKNETRHIIELQGTDQRIRAKTAWNADTLRGDYADVLILDEYQLMDETAWGEVGAPMMLDTNGDAIFIYTPPSVRSASTTKARDKMHAAKFYKKAQADETGRWATFHFSSRDNPHLSTEALDEIAEDMSSLAYRQEILAEDIDEVPGALWTRAMIDDGRIAAPPHLVRIVIAIDPATTATSDSDETGIVVAGVDAHGKGYVLEDLSGKHSPFAWAQIALDAFERWEADRIVAETNNGGDLVETNIRTLDDVVPIRQVRASRGKYTRAEPVAALYEKKKVFHVGNFDLLEDQLCSFVPGDSKSPDRLDALVWALTSLMLNKQTMTTSRVDWYNVGRQSAPPPIPARTDEEIERLLSA